MKPLYLALLILSVTACSINIVGLTNDYDKLSTEQRNLIKPFKSFDALQSGNIYPINAKQLQEGLKEYPQSMVYIFTNGCEAGLCLPLADYLNYGEKHGYKVFLVMTGYGNLDETISQNVDAPLLAIDGDYYGEKYRHNYTRQFFNEMDGRDRFEKEDIVIGPLLFYSFGELTKSGSSQLILE